ncbi:MAG: transketolase [Oscillospiraceae bacterium]|nr:transketolase [Oscillospiraceae bacterium]MDY4192478.1 transketolase [Oscillospiraceae bacterium]
MDEHVKRNLKRKACQIRLGAVEGVFCAKAGHPGGALSIADLLAYLYFKEMRIDPENPKWEDRDRFVLSKGHACPSLYAALALRGYFSMDEMKTLRHPGAMLQGHPDMKHIPGVDMTTGSLGQGVSAACGMALSGKISEKDYRVYAVLGDGEIEEGQVWESAMFAAHYKLDNLCVIVDNNGLQIDGPVAEVCSPYPIPEKFAAFGFHVINIDGHDYDQIEAAMEEAKAVKGKPTAIIAKTVKGKDVSFMENNVNWHGAAPNAEQYEVAVKDLNAVLAGLEG